MKRTFDDFEDNIPLNLPQKRPKENEKVAAIETNNVNIFGNVNLFFKCPFCSELVHNAKKFLKHNYEKHFLDRCKKEVENFRINIELTACMRCSPVKEFPDLGRVHVLILLTNRVIRMSLEVIGGH